jgi:phage terminase large subunit-like protein
MGNPYFYDAGLAHAAVSFFPRHLKLVDAEWAGRPFHLSKWQARDVSQIFGWRRKSDGTRRYRRVRIWVARKNGKTELAAGLGHLFAIADGEPGAQVYSHALDKNQATILFDKACRMVALSESLFSKYEVSKTALFAPKLMSTFRPLSGESVGKHGLSPHANLGDEAHEWRNDRLHTYLVQGMAARRQPIDLIISTAGEIKTYGHELYLDSKAIATDPALDPECYVAIYEADAEDDWTDPRIWAKANPNLGISVKRDFLEDFARRAKTNPRLENDFRRYHLNQWVEQQTRWLPMLYFAANTAEPDNPSLWKQLAARMKGRKGFCALDLGSTRDLTGKLWLFPPDDDNGRFVIVPTFWCPEDTVPVRDSPRTPYKRWVSEKAIMVTPGNVTDYDFIEAEVMRDVSERGFEFLSAKDEKGKRMGLAIDRWNATQVSVHLIEEGIPVVPFGQGYKSMGAPSKFLETLWMSGRLEHGNHPVLRWMFGNAVVRRDPTDAIKPDKSKAAEMIEGVVCLVMTLGLFVEMRRAQSVYEKRGALIV